MKDFTLIAEHVQVLLPLDRVKREEYLACLPLEQSRILRDLLQFENTTWDLSKISAIELALDFLAEPTLENVGRWKVRDLIGRGGMATVYLVERDEGAIRQVGACKIGYACTYLEDGLRRETSTLLDLNHPGIAHVLDFGHTDSGRPFLVSELVDGSDILSFVNRQRMTVDTRLTLFEDVLSAVAHAHERLLLHQDIKPDNILIDEACRPRLIDFGLATVLSPSGDSPVRGYTPRYASPEQKSGDRLTVRSDVYSLGLTLSELLLATPESHERVEAEAVAAKACQEDPANRYDSVAAMAADLRAIRNRRPVSVRSGTSYRLKCFLRRHPTHVALGSFIALSVVFGTAATVWQARKAIDAGQVAELERQRATATSAFLVNLFVSVSPTEGGRAGTRVVELLEPAFDRLKVDEALGLGARVDIARALAGAYGSLGQPVQASDVRIWAIAQAQAAGDVRAEAQLLLDEANMRSNIQQLEAATEALNRAIAISEMEPDLRDQARYSLLGFAFMSEKWPVALTLADQLSTDADRGSEFLTKQVGALAYFRSAALMKLGQLDAAELAAQVAQAEYVIRFGERSGPVSTVLDLRMQLAMAAGHFERADTIADELLRIIEAVFGRTHPRYAEVLSNVGLLRQYQGRALDAERIYREAFTLIQAAHGLDSPRTATVQQNLSTALVDLGDGEQGLIHIQAALSTFTNVFGPDHVLTLKADSLVADALARSGRQELALERFESLDNRFASVAPEAFERADSLLSHASALLDSGRYAECADRAARALFVLERVYGSAHWFFDQYAAHQGYCRAMLGDVEARMQLAAAVAALSQKLPSGSPDLMRARGLLERLQAQSPDN